MEQQTVDTISVFKNLPGNNVLVLPDSPVFTIVAVSDSYLRITGRNIEELEGKGLFEAFPNNPEDLNKTSEKTVRASLEYALRHKEKHNLPLQRYDIPVGDSFQERYWKAYNKPVLNEKGQVIFLIHNIEDVTDQIREKEKAARAKAIEKAYSLLMQAPAMIAIVKGPDHILELANEKALRWWNKSAAIIGKPLLKGIPELKDHIIINQIDTCLKTRKSISRKEVPVSYLSDAEGNTHFLDIVYEPFHDDGYNEASVFILFYDVTESVRSRQRAEENEEKYRTLFESIDQGFCIIELIYDEEGHPVDHLFLESNPAYEQQTGLRNVVGRTARELTPGIESHWFELYHKVVTTGKATRFIEGSDALDKWFDVYAFPLGGPASRKLAVLFTDITRRRKAEEILRISEERLQRVLSIETVGVIYFDLEGKIHDANEAFVRMSGYSREDFRQGKVRWTELTPPEFMAVTIVSREELLQKWQNTPYEKQYIRPDGNRWWGLFAGKRLSQNECVEFVLDITEQKHIQYALEKSESNLRNIILHAPVAMCILKGSSFIVEIANDKMFELWGRRPEVITNKPVWESLPEARHSGMDDLLNNVYITGKSVSFNEFAVTLPSGNKTRTAYVNFSFEPFRTADNAITGVLAVAVDVTEQVNARINVEEANKELSFVLDIIPQMVWHTLPDGWANFFNQTYLDYTGMVIEELTGHQWMQLIHPDDLDVSISAWNEALEGRDPAYTVEHRIKGKDGAYRWFLTRGVPLKDEQGRILKWYGTTTDIQKQKTIAEVLENKVKDRTRELEMRTRELEQFTYVSHHDLQEPLRKIIMYTDMVRSDSYDRLTESSRKRFDKVIEAAKRMSAALKDVLNYASLSKEEQFKDVDLDDILASVQMDLELMINEKGAKIHSDELPTIRAIPGQMHQLFYNLLNNALKFSREDVPIIIKIKCQPLDLSMLSKFQDLQKDKTFYQITVQDNGIGFDQDAAEKIFVMFQRLHSKEDYAGTGVGLALCRKVVLNHGGKIWAESTQGNGAQFTIILPAH